MLKRITLVKRNPNMSREQFIKHYEEVHVPLALKHLPLERICHNYVIVPPGAEEPEIDCFSETWYKDKEALDAVARILGMPDLKQTVTADNVGYTTDIGKLMRDDSMIYTDWKFKTFFVEERVSTK